MEHGAGRHHFDLHARRDAPVHQAHVNDDALIGVVLAVKHERFQRRFRVACRCRDVRNHILKYVMNIEPHFCRDLGRILCRDADDVLDFLLDARRVGGRQVNFIDDRQHLQPRVDGKVGIAKGLRFDALRCVHNEQRALTRGERTRNLVVEVHVPRGIDEIHVIDLPVIGFVLHAHRTRLDGDAAFALQIHIVEQLLFHLALRNRFALLKQAVGKRGFAMVDMGDDRKISDMLLIFHVFTPSQRCFCVIHHSIIFRRFTQENHIENILPYHRPVLVTFTKVHATRTIWRFDVGCVKSAQSG